MRVVAVYDAAGKIVTLMSIPRDGPSGGLQIRAGQRTSEFDVPEIPDYQHQQETYNQLVELAQRFRVETDNQQPRLVRKGDADEK